MPPRIAHIVQDMKIGGQERVIQSIVTAMSRDRYEPVLLCLTAGGAIADDLIKNGIETHILGIKNYNTPRSLLRVAGWLKKNGIGLVHTHAHPAGYLGRMGALLQKDVGIVHHVHTLPLDMRWRHHQKERGLGLFTDRIICVSSAIRDFILEKEHVARKKVTVIYNGIREPVLTDFNRLTLLDSLGIPHDAPIIGSVASFTENKGHFCLLQAFALVLREVPGARLLLLGDGPLHNPLREAAARMGIGEHVFFLGNRENVFPFVALFDIFILASLYREGLSIAIIEAMALGKPVVASRLQGIAEAVQDGRSGTLVPVGDAACFAREIIGLLGDKERRTEMGATGRRIYQDKFKVERMMLSIEDIYETVLRSRGRQE